MNKELVNKIVAMFNTGDTTEVSNIFGKDYLDHQKPEWFTVDGPEEFAQIVKLARDNLPNLKVTVLGKIFAEEDMVAMRLLWSSDASVRETIEILRVDDGKFVEHWGAQSYEKKVSKTQDRISSI